MKRIVSSFAVFFIFSIVTFGQNKTDYSGTWVFSKIISSPTGILRIATFKMVIDQTQNETKVETFVNNIQQTDGRSTDGKSYYPFEKENIMEVKGSGSEKTITRRADFTKVKLALTSSQTIKTGDKKITAKLSEVFELSKDGKTLKVLRKLYSEDNLTVEIFIANKQQENTPSVNDKIVYDIAKMSEFKDKFNNGVLNGSAKYLEKPDYPSSAAIVKAKGVVPVRIIFNEAGKVEFAQALSGHQSLKESAVEAAIKSIFNPVKLNDSTIKVSGTIIYIFSGI